MMFNKKQKVLWIALAVIGIVAAFLYLNFRAARSSTKVEHQVSTYSYGFEKGESLPANAPLSLAVIGRDSLARIIARRLEHKFLAGPFTRVDQEEVVRTDIDQFQVSVSLVDRSVIWTPLYARASLKIHFAFSSNGDLSWQEDDVVAFSSDQGQVVAVRGDIQLSDTTYGLISRPAYHSHLADELALRIDEAIRKALASPANPALSTDP